MGAQVREHHSHLLLLCPVLTGCLRAPPHQPVPLTHENPSPREMTALRDAQRQSPASPAERCYLQQLGDKGARGGGQSRHPPSFPCTAIGSGGRERPRGLARLPQRGLGSCPHHLEQVTQHAHPHLVQQGPCSEACCERAHTLAAGLALGASPVGGSACCGLAHLRDNSVAVPACQLPWREADFGFLQPCYSRGSVTAEPIKCNYCPLGGNA